MKRMITLFAGAALLASTAHAGPDTDVADVKILPGWTNADGTHTAAFQIALAPGWKTYWRAPGDAGIPPLIRFAPDSNVADFSLRWPTPDIMDQNGMRAIGYHDGVVLPLVLSPADPSQPIRLTGHMEIGVCEDICIPVQLEFDAPLPPSTTRDPMIVAALVDRPLTRDEAGVTSATCTLAAGTDGLTLTATIGLPAAEDAAAIVVETGDPGVWVSQADVIRDGTNLTAVADLVPVTDRPLMIDRSALRFTVLGRGDAVDIVGCDAP